MRKFKCIGLRSYTPEEVTKQREDLTRKGYTVQHKTHSTRTGEKLAYNGVLIATR